MAILKCKMCGGDILLSEDKTTGTCDHCGSTMTFPRVSDEQKLNLYNRANHFRRQNEFDKAITAYERILDQDDTDAEAHWGAVLSRYGIEYVEDPVTHERIPTCHRVQLSSILSDGDYLAALENAPDTASRDLYEQEARRIAEIQKGILSISSQEKPYDVFICYKETDDSGSRTKDSTLAQEIYYQLTNEGYKVFFSRITLEDKLGQQYEPYIFAALNSAKVMLVIGTKPEYLGAVWVKNEWSRYLALMKNDRTRLLIPCYRDMDAYDLPDDLSGFQSQDMSKIGFMQDLIRGIKKVLDTEKKAEQPLVVQQAAPASFITPLLRRAFMFLEDRDWKSADEYAEKVLDLEPENAQAYLMKMLTEMNLPKPELLSQQAEPFLDHPQCRKALRYADPQFAEQIKGWNQTVVDRIEKKKQTEERVRAIIEAFEAKKHAYDNVKFTQERIKVLEHKAISTQTELSNLRGLFVAGKRKALESKLQQIKSDIEQAKSRLRDLEARQQIPKQKEKPDVREMHYQAAQLYLQAEMYTAAYKHLMNSRGYKDTDSLLANDHNLMAAAAAREAKLALYKTAGSCVTFGTYPQTAGGTDSTAIEWLVLDYDAANNRTLLISRYGLDAKPYNTEYTIITWEKCTLRTWLNNTFYNKAFSVNEQSAILLTNVDNSGSQGYSGWSTSGGNNTQDKIFLLSYAEANKYFNVTYSDSNNTKSRVQPTAYAIKQGAYTSSSNKTADGAAAGWWWLRSPSHNQSVAALVIHDGSPSYYYVNSPSGAVRPAFWLNLGADF